MQRESEWPLKQIFVVSIRAKRLHRCLQRLGPLAQFVTIVPACHGEKIDREQWGSTIGNGGLRRGELGCFESHCRVWRYIVENDIHRALVLEDDVVFLPKQRKRVSNLMAHIGWDLLLLGRHAQPNCPKNRQSLGNGLVVTGAFHGTHAYAITGSAALRLLMHPSIQVMSAPIDCVLSDMGLRDELLIVACDPDTCTLLGLDSDTTFIQ